MEVDNECVECNKETRIIVECRYECERAEYICSINSGFLS